MLTKDQILEAIEEIRHLDFGVYLGTLGEEDYSVQLIFWPNTLIEFKEIKGPIDQIMTDALLLARDYRHPTSPPPADYAPGLRPASGSPGSQ